MLSSMLLCFFYSSTLKSHLTSPVLIPSLKSFAEIVEGHLPWKIPPFISSEYAWLPTLNNSVIRKLWNERIVLDGFSTPVRNNLLSPHLWYILCMKHSLTTLLL